MQTAIYLRHRGRVMVPPGDGAAAPTYLATLLKNIEGLGWTCSLALIEQLKTCSVEQLARLADELVPALRALVGANVSYRPMYPNFPQQVMDASRAELYLNAIIHYLTLGLPPTPKLFRPKLLERTDLRAIEPGDEADFRAICTRLLSSKLALSPADRADVTWFFETYGDRALALIPSAVPNRENVALLGALLLRHTTGGASQLPSYVTTATDVLRLAVALSDGDTSLATPTKFRSFTRGERRLLLELLEGCGNVTEDMLRRPEPWKRLGERLHPTEYQRRFPQSVIAFDVIRNDRPYPTFASRVEGALSRREVGDALELLATRPGELARRLDHLLRLAGEPDTVVAAFGDVAARVSTPVLLAVLAHFRDRPQPRPLRTFFPKGEVAKAQAIPNTCRRSPRLCATVYWRSAARRW
ncbi:MAG: hypothetical protein RLZZ387_4920 [Chloroflexota bacterium]|jgi:hypothetical protein